jgi:hypothetical protein
MLQNSHFPCLKKRQFPRFFPFFAPKMGVFMYKNAYFPQKWVFLPKNAYFCPKMGVFSPKLRIFVSKCVFFCQFCSISGCRRLSPPSALPMWLWLPLPMCHSGNCGGFGAKMAILGGFGVFFGDFGVFLVRKWRFWGDFVAEMADFR